MREDIRERLDALLERAAGNHEKLKHRVRAAATEARQAYGRFENGFGRVLTRIDAACDEVKDSSSGVRQAAQPLREELRATYARVRARIRD